MTKKKWLIAAAALAAVVLLALAIVLLSGNQFTVARCIVTGNRSLYMVYDGRPVHLACKPTDCQTGDKLLILHQSAFAESFPERTRAYWVMKIGSGSRADIPQSALDALIATGNWTE